MTCLTMLPAAPVLAMLEKARTGIVYATIIDGGTMRMRAVEAIPIAMGGTRALQPGQRFHLMLVNLAKATASR